MTAAAPVLVADRLRFSYGEAGEVLRGVNAELHSGRITALIGNNGAGKTTLLRLLAGLLKPSSGRLELHPTLDHRRSLGVLLGAPLAWRALTVERWLNAFAGFYSGVDQRWQRELLDRLQLDPTAAVRTLSSGNLQKLHLVRALQHRPALLLFDEPTSRLDPNSRRIFWPLIRQMAQQGSAVMISSHQLEELEQEVDDALLLEAGIIAETAILNGVERGWRIELHCSSERLLKALGERGNRPIALREEQGRTIADWPATADRRVVLAQLLEAGIDPVELGPTPLFDHWREQL